LCREQVRGKSEEGKEEDTHKWFFEANLWRLGFWANTRQYGLIQVLGFEFWVLGWGR